MEIKRCYDTIIGASVAENQLCNGESVTVPNGHKFYLKKSGTESLGASTGTAITGLTSGTDMVIDLTQLLGTAIADYTYTIEQATAGSGITWLRSYGFITDDYKPYNAGSIESVEATAKVVKDENGENEITYPLGNDTLRGIFKLDSNNNLYADGDRKTSDGTITRRYGVVDLGTLTWRYVESSKWIYARLNNSISLTYGMPNAISNIPYNMVSAQSLSANDVGWTIYAGAMYVRNTSASEADLRALVVGKTAVYELATPTTEQSTPFTSPQIVYPDGTEEYVTSNGVPVGHETKYQL